MTESDLPLTNQTTFATEQPYYEEPVDLSEKPTETPKKQLSLIQKILIAGASFVGLILLIVVVTMLLNQRPVKQVSEETEEAVQQVKLDPLQARIKSLGEEVQLADPRKQELPVPLVDFKLRLDKAKQ